MSAPFDPTTLYGDKTTLATKLQKDSKPEDLPRQGDLVECKYADVMGVDDVTQQMVERDSKAYDLFVTERRFRMNAMSHIPDFRPATFLGVVLQVYKKPHSTFTSHPVRVLRTTERGHTDEVVCLAKHLHILTPHK